MLDRGKLIVQMRQLEQKLFKEYTVEHDRARRIWERMVNDPTFVYAVRERQGQIPWLIPSWQPEKRLDTTTVIDQPIAQYRLCSVDGSQIYPDRHQGSACFLLNIGTVELSYGLDERGARLNSWPMVYAGDEVPGGSPEVVNALRQDAELQAGVQLSRQLHEQKLTSAPYLFVCDGSLIFWHLEAQATSLREQFLPSYLMHLEQLYQDRTLVAGYISAPRSRELVNLVRFALHQEKEKAIGSPLRMVADQEDAVAPLVDASIVSFFLSPGERTIIFKNHAAVTDYYPEHLQPYFFYMHMGDEIGRVEIPAWIAQDEEAVTTIAQIMIDQSKKGNGYPVAIAEAHEQAVVKGPDREFFYQLLGKIGIEQKRRIMLSRKSYKKRYATF